MSGVIPLGGKPAAHARLVRTANRDGDITDETTNNEKGYFKFQAIYDFHNSCNWDISNETRRLQ